MVDHPSPAPSPFDPRPGSGPGSGEPVDHRRLGRELGLFGSDPLIGAGLPYWLPDGAAARQAVEGWLRELQRRAGYQQVYSPVLGKRELYEISGHWAHYQDDMYPPMELSSREGAEQLVLRPSLCPHHAVIFASRGRSHHELPVRLAEIGGQYRSERSGVLGGLSRVRAMQLADAHLFCAPHQLAHEVGGALDLVDQAFDALGIDQARYRLSLRGQGEKYLAKPAMWDRAEAALRDVLEARGAAYRAEPGEAAFYGPKIDIQVQDAQDREISLSTVQVDFHQPEQFRLAYVGADGARHRPVMVHAGVIGSLERLFAHLIELHQGAFPAWYAPWQVAVLPVGADQQAPAYRLADGLVRRGLRARVEPEGSLGVRIAAQRLVPYLAVLGAREVADGSVAVRQRDGSRRPAQPLAEVVERLVADCAPPV